LKEIYDKSRPGNGYDKYIELETGKLYTGGLYIGATFNRITAEFIGEGLDVRIKGNGAILDLEGGEICISYCTNKLDIDDCVVINGDIRYRGVTGGPVAQPTGFVRHITFYKPHDYAVRIYGAGTGITVERNIFVDAVDTGRDFHYISGVQMDWLPTGGNMAFSGFVGLYGMPDIVENWSFHSDPAANADPLRHYVFLCEYG
jgi:hypothetical protein